MLMKAVVWLRTTTGHATTGIAALGSLAWFLWPDTNWSIHPDALLAFVLAMVAWITSISPSRGPSKHDMELFARFGDLFTEGEMIFLRDYDLAGPFKWDNLSGTNELVRRWSGAVFEFDDRKIQKKFALVLEHASGFIHALALGTHIGRGGFATTIPDREVPEEMSSETWEAIKAHNKRATELRDEIEGFIRYARPRLYV
jgi:hypothetical protein